MRLYKTQYSFRISGNRGYDSNRVRFKHDRHDNQNKTNVLAEYLRQL